jgi:RNA polymerase sigma factor (TIGR02999 family)
MRWKEILSRESKNLSTSASSEFSHVVEKVPKVLRSFPFFPVKKPSRLQLTRWKESSCELGRQRLTNVSSMSVKSDTRRSLANQGMMSSHRHELNDDCARQVLGLMSDVTNFPSIDKGDSSAAEQLLPLVYDELRRLAAAKLSHERPGQMLSATALVHEAYLRLVNGDSPPSWNGRGHFFAAAAEAMRRILCELARKRKSLKGGGNRKRVEIREHHAEVNAGGLDEMLTLKEALKMLERSNARAAQVVELRFFGGLTIAKTAAALEISIATADNDWAFARSWLHLKMTTRDES